MEYGFPTCFLGTRQRQVVVIRGWFQQGDAGPTARAALIPASIDQRYQKTLHVEATGQPGLVGLIAIELKLIANFKGLQVTGNATIGCLEPGFFQCPYF